MKELTTYEMVDCLKSEVIKSKNNLENYVSEVRNSYLADDSNRKAFELAQSKWEEYVDADCKAVNEEFSGGSIRGVMVNTCLIGHRSERMKNIWNTYLDNTATKLPDPNKN